MFSGVCQVRSAGIEDSGRVQIDLKPEDGSFDWRPFLAKKEQNREVLAIAIAAITANKTVWCQAQSANSHSEILIIFLRK